MGAKITAIEYVFPKTKVTNTDLKSEFPDYDFDTFEKKVGIRNRYIVEPGITSLDLAIEACEKVLARYNRDKIDFILFCTQSPDYILPTTACILQQKLRLNDNVGAFDFNLGCSGYVYGLSVAKSLIESKQAKNVLLVTAETYSKYIHIQDRSNRAIFGDAATCSLVSESDDSLINEFLFGTDGSGFDKLIIKNGLSRNQYQPQAAEKKYGSDNVYTDNHLYMNGPEIFNFTAEKIPRFTEEVLNKNNLKREDVGQFIFHQANAFMLNFLRKRIKVEKEKFYIDLQDGGNTVSNTIPIALKNYSSRLTKNGIEDIILVGFGVGLSWAGCAIKIDCAL